MMARRLLRKGDRIRTKRRLASNGWHGYGTVTVDMPHPDTPVYFVTDNTGVSGVALRSEVVLSRALADRL